MEETLVNSRKIKHGKKLRIAWLVLAALFLAVTILSVVQYAAYKKGQDAAVEITLAVKSGIYGDTRKELIEKLYEYYNPEYHYNSFIGMGNGAVIDAARDADIALGEMLTSLGHKCLRGSDYLKYTRFVDFTIHENMILYIAVATLCLTLLVLNILYVSNRKKSMTISDDRIICKKGKKVTKEFFIRDIKSVDQPSSKGLRICGNGIKYKINALENAEELKTSIMAQLAEIASAPEAGAASQHSNADELKKYKELLDMGAITQEEFDSKKKELLGL